MGKDHLYRVSEMATKIYSPCSISAICNSVRDPPMSSGLETAALAHLWAKVGAGWMRH